MTTRRGVTTIIAVLALFGLAAIFVASEAETTASADHSDSRRYDYYIGLWQTIQVNSDGALQTFSISDPDGDGVYQLAMHEEFLSLCDEGFGVISGTAAINEEGILEGDLTVTCTPGPVITDIHRTWEYLRKHDQIVGFSGDIYHRISDR